MTNTTAPLTADQRASKVAKITALLQKTEANGCTPDEAFAAREMADQLMAKYGINASECKPQTTRRPRPSSDGDWISDLFRRASEETLRQQRAENAKAQYRRNGVHIDEGFHADCRCTACRAHFGRRAAGDAYDYMADEPSRGRGTTGGTGRKNTSHKYCDHEATSSARARCRKNRGY